MDQKEKEKQKASNSNILFFVHCRPMAVTAQLALCVGSPLLCLLFGLSSAASALMT